jgi:hypothetical protein
VTVVGRSTTVAVVSWPGPAEAVVTSAERCSTFAASVWAPLSYQSRMHGRGIGTYLVRQWGRGKCRGRPYTTLERPCEEPSFNGAEDIRTPRLAPGGW